MVRRDNKIRAGMRFINLKDILKREASNQLKRKVSDREITDNIADFLEEEALVKHMVFRVRKRRGGFF